MYEQLLQLEQVMRFCISAGDNHYILMFILQITFLLTSLNTVEIILPTLRLTQTQKSRGYAALTNHLKLRLLSTFDEKSLAIDKLKNEVNDGK